MGNQAQIERCNALRSGDPLSLKLSHFEETVVFVTLMSSPTPNGPNHPWSTEREFLHALSTPLSTLGLELDHLKECLKDPMKNPKAINDTQVSVEQMRKVLDRVYQLIQARRAQLPQK